MALRIDTGSDAGKKSPLVSIATKGMRRVKDAATYRAKVDFPEPDDPVMYHRSEGLMRRNML